MTSIKCIFNLVQIHKPEKKLYFSLIPIYKYKNIIAKKNVKTLQYFEIGKKIPFEF